MIDISKKILDAEYLDTLISMTNLALTFWSQGRWKEAEELGVQMIDISKKTLDAKYSIILTNIANLALIYRD